MNPRERLLLTIIAVLALIGAALGAGRLYVARSEKLAQDLQYEQNRLKDARKRLAAAEAAEIEWKAVGRQTIAADAMVAKGRFREELIRLATESGFSVPPTQIDLIGAVSQGRNGLTTVVYQVKAEGTTSRVVDLLSALYRQPYLVRCRSIELKPVVDKGRPAEASPAAVRRLALSLSVETPILPSDRRVPKIDAMDSLAGPAGLVNRLNGRSVSEYRVISDDLFGPPLRIVQGPDGSGSTGGGPRTEDPKRNKKPIDPDPPDAHLLLARVLSSPRIQQVVLADPANTNAADRRVEVGDEMYEGTLIFIHRTGAVSESKKDGKRRFHAVGLPLDQAEELSVDRHPEVVDSLRKLESRMASGSGEPVWRPVSADEVSSQPEPFVPAGIDEKGV